MEELKYTISEASERLDGLSYRTLHYYESKIGLNIARDGAGNRVYTEHDIELYENIIGLKKKGMTLDGIKALFQEKGIVDQEQDKHIVVVDEKALEMKEYLISEIRQAVSLQMKEELEETNFKLDQILQENSQLKEELHSLRTQNEEHYSAIDQKIALWREQNKNEKEKSWVKKLFNK